MARVLFLFLLTSLHSSLASQSNIVNFLYGFSVGYPLSATCQNELNTGIDAQWFIVANTNLDGSGAALTKFRDFTGYLVQTATDCNFLQIANLMDSALTTNLLATLLRLIAGFQDISNAWTTFWTSLVNFDFTTAGDGFGIIVNKLVG